jgi:hypothetical protein
MVLAVLPRSLVISVNGGGGVAEGRDGIGDLLLFCNGIDP